MGSSKQKNHTHKSGQGVPRMRGKRYLSPDQSRYRFVCLVTFSIEPTFSFIDFLCVLSICYFIHFCICFLLFPFSFFGPGPTFCRCRNPQTSGHRWTWRLLFTHTRLQSCFLSSHAPSVALGPNSLRRQLPCPGRDPRLFQQCLYLHF